MLFTSIIFSFAGIFLSDTIAFKMAANPELQTLCKQYLSINLVYCCGIFLQTYGQRLLQAVGDTVLSMISLIIGAILNIILDPIMIFGLFGCPAMGIRGAAITTVIGQMVGPSLLYCLTVSEIRSYPKLSGQTNRVEKSRTAAPGSYDSSICRKSAAMGILRRH